VLLLLLLLLALLEVVGVVVEDVKEVEVRELLLVVLVTVVELDNTLEPAVVVVVLLLRYPRSRRSCISNSACRATNRSCSRRNDVRNNCWSGGPSVPVVAVVSSGSAEFVEEVSGGKGDDPNPRPLLLVLLVRLPDPRNGDDSWRRVRDLRPCRRRNKLGDTQLGLVLCLERILVPKGPR